MARVEVSTEPIASILAHPGKPIIASGSVLKPFAPIRARFACARSKHVPIAIKCEAEELLQCERVEFATAACSRVRMKHRPPAALENSLPVQFITYQTRNSVQSNGASSQLARYASALGAAPETMLGLYFPLLAGWREWRTT